MSRVRRLVLTFAIMAASLLQVLDSTIANVALPHMQAALSATQDGIAWVITSYIVAAAIGTPLTGWLEGRMGRRRLFTVAVAGFTVSSALCGASQTLTMMVASRGLQGLFGAFLTPLSQSAMLDIFPVEQRARAMFVWGMGLMVGPVLGPLLGGWITDWYNWRWIFYVNVPIGVMACILLWLLSDDGQTPRRRFDGVGFGLLAIGLASLQLMIDRGTQRDWFESTEIIVEAGLAIAALWMFVIHVLTSRSPLLPRQLFADRNFVAANVVLLLTVAVYMPSATLISPFLQQLFGYGTIDAGLLMMPRALGVLVGMILATRLSGKADLRPLILIGFVCIAVGQWMMTGFNLEMNARPIIVTGVICGFGIGAVTMPLTLIAYATLPGHLRTEATALYSLSRNVAASISISVMTALIARNSQINHAEVGAHVTDMRMPLLDPHFVQANGHFGGAAAAMVDTEINRQAVMIAYLNDFWLMMWLCLIAMPIVLLLRHRRPDPAEMQHVIME